MGGPALKITKNYDLFELHAFNRPLHYDRTLEASMKEHGFMPSSPLQCIDHGDGKLKIITGHHRFDVAKRLGLGIWYVIDNANEDIFDLKSCKSQWSIRDFAEARANAGDEDCLKLLSFVAKHGIPLAAAAARKRVYGT